MVLQCGEPLNLKFDTSFVGSLGVEADPSLPLPESGWCLLEVTSEQADMLEAGKSFFFQSHSSGCCALATPDATFSLEFLENSNTLYVAHAEKGGSKDLIDISPGDRSQGEKLCKTTSTLLSQATVLAQCKGHLIQHIVAPDAQRVRDILMPHVLGQELISTNDTNPIPPSGITTELLECEVAASPRELRDILAGGPYVEHIGFWYYLPVPFEREIMDTAVTVMAARGWGSIDVDMQALLSEVQQHLSWPVHTSAISLSVLRKALRTIVLSSAGEEDAKTANNLHTFDDVKVKRFQVLQLLRSSPSEVRERFGLELLPPRKRARHLAGPAVGGRDRALRSEELVAACQHLFGDVTLEEIEKILGDQAYIDDCEGTIHPLDPTGLPQEPRERLKRLLELLPCWKPERLSALMAPTVVNQKIDVWLGKCTRAVYMEFEKGEEQRVLIKKFGGAL